MSDVRWVHSANRVRTTMSRVAPVKNVVRAVILNNYVIFINYFKLFSNNFFYFFFCVLVCCGRIKNIHMTYRSYFSPIIIDRFFFPKGCNYGLYCCDFVVVLLLLYPMLLTESSITKGCSLWNLFLYFSNYC